MKNLITAIALFFVLFVSFTVLAQDHSDDPQQQDQINTLFKGKRVSNGGYGAITNKFTNINGQFANLAGIYGGWYVNHRFMIGAGAAALTNDIRVPIEHRIDPLKDLSYMYGQVGLVTEYVIASNSKVHAAFHLFSGGGFTIQYERRDWEHDDHEIEWEEEDRDWFFVAEPGVMVEFNVFKWMRFSPGISYRATFGSDGLGLGDSALSDISYNATLKFGRF